MRGDTTLIKIKNIYRHFFQTVRERGAGRRGGRTCCHGNQSLSSLSSVLSRFSLCLRLVRSSSRELIMGPPLSIATTPLCLFPKRPIGLTPRSTYQNGSISGPSDHNKGYKQLISSQFIADNNTSYKQLIRG